MGKIEIINNRCFCINDYKYSLFRVENGKWLIYLRGECYGWYGGSGDSSLKNDQLKRVKNHGITYLDKSITQWEGISHEEIIKNIKPYVGGN